MSSSSSSSSLLQKANELFVDEQFDDALKLYNDALLASHNDAHAENEVLLKRAQCQASETRQKKNTNNKLFIYVSIIFS
jgi:vacuolar-type H+-ATPase subunit H